MDTQPHPFDVCMVCALPEEARAFLEAVGPYCDGAMKEQSSSRYQYSYRTTMIRNTHGEPLTLHISWLARYGPPEMALHLSHVLQECQPRIAIMTGICAGDAAQVQLGDLVIAERTFTYDSGKFTFDAQGRQVHLHDTQTDQLDAAILQFLGLFDDWKPLVAALPRPATPSESDHKACEVRCHLKAMASGSAVRTDHPFRDVQVPVRSAAAIDMEGAAFALAASRHHHTPWLLVKGVCDYADSRKNDAYHDYAARASAAYALSFIRAYVTHERLPRREGFFPTGQAVSPRIWNIPYPRNPFFTGREELLERLHARLQDSQTAVLGQPQALSGLGGVGKTQLAVEYAYRYRQAYPQAVLWAGAETTETLDSSYVEIARLLQLPEKDEPTQELIVQAVKNWLSTQSGWLLILDNADDLSIIPAFLPKNFIGHLLLTTREQALGMLAQSLEVDTLAEEQGALLLLRRAKVIAPNESLEHASEQDRTTASAIARELGGLPLALDQAAAYIEETRCSLARYQLQYQASQRQFLARRGGKGVQLHPQSVTTTLLSFAKIERMPVAADLLRFCAFLAPDAIPERLLVQAMFVLRRDALSAGLLSRWLPFQKKKAARPLTVTIEELWGEVQEALLLWRSYSFVQRVEAEELLSVHRLVQAVIRDSLSEQEQVVWMERVIRAMAACFPSGDELAVCALYFPHVLKCEEWVTERKLASLKGASLFSRVGYYLIMRVQYDDAERFFQLALAIRKKQCGESHIEVADSLNDLGVLAEHRGQFAEAEHLYEQALAIAQRDQQDWKGLNEQLLYNLANISRRLGKDELAEQFLLRLGEQQKKLWRNETTKTLTRKANLYLNQGAYEQAEQLYLRVYELHEQYEGIDSPGTAGAMTNLAALYKTQGKFAQAEPLYQAVLSIYTRHRGDDHPSVADCLSKLGDMYEKQDKHEQAELFYQRALAIREQRLGDAHPDTASSLIDLAYLYKFQGRYAEAEPLYQRALAICEQCLGAEHPDTIWALSSLGDLYEKQGKNEQAEKLYLHALSIREQHLGANHHDTAGSLNSLARFYYAQGKYREAEPLLVRALAIHEQQVGAEHPTFQAVQANYTSVLKALKEDKDAPP